MVPDRCGTSQTISSLYQTKFMFYKYCIIVTKTNVFTHNDSILSAQDIDPYLSEKYYDVVTKNAQDYSIAVENEV